MSEGEQTDAKPRLSGFGLLALAALVVGIAVLLVGTHNENEAPFTAVQVHPELVSLRFAHPDGPGFPASVEGRVDVRKMSARNATYVVIVVDTRRHRVVPISGTGAAWNAAAASLRERYDWQPSDLDRAAFFRVGESTTLRFAARLPKEALPVADPRRAVAVVLALTHGSDHVYWAVKLN